MILDKFKANGGVKMHQSKGKHFSKPLLMAATYSLCAHDNAAEIMQKLAFILCLIKTLGFQHIQCRGGSCWIYLLPDQFKHCLIGRIESLHKLKLKLQYYPLFVLVHILVNLTVSAWIIILLLLQLQNSIMILTITLTCSIRTKGDCSQIWPKDKVLV